jgi:RES domain-containing protein
VKAQTLDRVLAAYRIGDPDGAYPIFDATGSKLSPGR